jgi:amidase
MPADITDLDAAALHAAIVAREVSCVEVMAAHLDRIEAVNPAHNAIVALQPREILIAQARDRDDQIARGDPIGPLHGFPHAVKDLSWVKGIPSTSGSPVLADFVPRQDSLHVARMRAAGAIFIGMTNTPEFGLGSHTYNRVYGATRNAVVPARSAGGSSGGAAVALAKHMVPLADGSDFGGSLRNPAGWNGVFGFRPSFGVVPAEARDAWLPGMGVTGPMARTVPDLARLLAVQAGHDPRAPLSQRGDGSRFLAPLEIDLRGRRIAWAGDFSGFTPCDPGVLELCRMALRRFEDLGAVVEDAVPDHPLEPVWEALLTLRAWQAGFPLLEFYRDPVRRALLKPEIIHEVEAGLALSAYDVAAASVVRTAWSVAVGRFLSRFDALVVPSAQVFPFPVEETWPREVAGRTMSTYHEWMKGNFLISMAGCPSLAAPAGVNGAGLPIGIQIVTPVHHDLRALRFAQAYAEPGFPSGPLAWNRRQADGR